MLHHFFGGIVDILDKTWLRSMTILIATFRDSGVGEIWIPCSACVLGTLHVSAGCLVLLFWYFAGYESIGNDGRYILASLFFGGCYTYDFLIRL
jgi:hypothetical protein